jgi:two-component system response regulator YesN
MLKVVIIDDEYFFRESIKTIIPWNEMNLLLAGEANNGEDALELIQKTQPDMALVDINMPIIGGIELASILNEQGIKTRIIIITGYSEFEYAQKAIKLE